MGGVCSDPALTYNERIVPLSASSAAANPSYITSYGLSRGLVPTTMTSTTTTTVTAPAASSSYVATPVVAAPAASTYAAAPMVDVVVGSNRNVWEQQPASAFAVAPTSSGIMAQPNLTGPPITASIVNNYADNKEVINNVPITDSLVTPPAPLPITTPAVVEQPKAASYVEPVALTSSALNPPASSYVNPAPQQVTTSVVKEQTNTYVEPVTQTVTTSVVKTQSVTATVPTGFEAAGSGRALAPAAASGYGQTTYSSTNYTTPAYTATASTAPVYSTTNYTAPAYTTTNYNAPANTSTSITYGSTTAPAPMIEAGVVGSKVDIYGHRMWTIEPVVNAVPTVRNFTSATGNAQPIGFDTRGLDIYGNARRKT